MSICKCCKTPLRNDLNICVFCEKSERELRYRIMELEQALATSQQCAVNATARIAELESDLEDSCALSLWAIVEWENRRLIKILEIIVDPRNTMPTDPETIAWMRSNARHAFEYTINRPGGQK